MLAGSLSRQNTSNSFSTATAWVGGWVVRCVGRGKGDCNTVEPLYNKHFEYKEHLSNEDSACCPNHIELCTNLPLN